MFSQPDQDTTLAFAAVFQSATLVSHLASEPNHDQDALHQSAYSLLRLDAPDTESIFGSRQGVSLGLRMLSRLLGGNASNDSRTIFQYSVSMHQLALKLASQPRFSTSMAAQLQSISDRYSDKYGDVEHDDALYEELADLYSDTISHMSPRIMVQGAPGRLDNQRTVNQVRTALFAGIRAAFLWHQLGGRKWQIMFQRNAYQRHARRLLVQSV